MKELKYPKHFKQWLFIYKKFWKFCRGWNLTIHVQFWYIYLLDEVFPFFIKFQSILSIEKGACEEMQKE